MSSNETKKMTVTLPIQLYSRLKEHADKIGISINRYVVSRLDERSGNVIFIGLQDLVCKVQRLYTNYDCIQASEEVREACQSLKCLKEELIAEQSFGRK